MPGDIYSCTKAVRAHRDLLLARAMFAMAFLISRGIPIVIDGRAEPYGEAFALTLDRALEFKDVNGFLTS
jgi:hypothetical protein